MHAVKCVFYLTIKLSILNVFHRTLSRINRVISRRDILKVIIILILLTSVSSLRAESLSLNFTPTVYEKKNIFNLKDLIRKSYPGFDVDNIQLIGLSLFAKANFEDGSSFLEIGEISSRHKAIPSDPDDFESEGKYHKIMHGAPNSDSKVWLLHVSGEVKIRKVELAVSLSNKAYSFECTYRLESNTTRHDTIEDFTEFDLVSVERACEKAKAACLEFDTEMTRCIRL